MLSIVCVSTILAMGTKNVSSVIKHNTVLCTKLCWYNYLCISSQGWGGFGRGWLVKHARKTIGSAECLLLQILHAVLCPQLPDDDTSESSLDLVRLR